MCVEDIVRIREKNKHTASRSDCSDSNMEHPHENPHGLVPLCWAWPWGALLSCGMQRPSHAPHRARWKTCSSGKGIGCDQPVVVTCRIHAPKLTYLEVKTAVSRVRRRLQHTWLHNMYPAAASKEGQFGAITRPKLCCVVVVGEGDTGSNNIDVGDFPVAPMQRWRLRQLPLQLDFGLLVWWLRSSYDVGVAGSKHASREGV